MARTPEQILVLGIGNILMGDEGIGARVAQFLSEQKLPANVQCIDGGTGGFHLLGYLQEAGRVILIDATMDGREAGSWRRLEPRYSSDYPPTLTAHDIGLKDLLDAVYILGNPPQVILYAISINPPQGVSTSLSAQLERRVNEFAGLVRREIDLLNSVNP